MGGRAGRWGVGGSSCRRGWGGEGEVELAVGVGGSGWGVGGGGRVMWRGVGGSGGWRRSAAGRELRRDDLWGDGWV